QSEGKEWVRSALWGLLLLVGAYVVLNTVNPGLVKLRLAGLAPIPEAVITGGTGGVGGGYGTRPCFPASTGPASIDTLRNSCFRDRAEEASAIAMAESGGNPFIPSGVDKCQPGGEPVSWGLFQINLSANGVGGLHCQSAFDRTYTQNNHNCTIVNRPLYDQCVAAAKDPQKNIAAACQIYNAAGGWRPWGANRVCGF
ncbi:hypothetical protein C4571_02735, partial [Candidatus Parcubacteria bacterium]